MARKPKEVDQKPVETTELEVDLVSHLQTSYKAYGEHTLEERSMPDYRDGLKPVHRRVLYAMAELGVFSNKKQTKSARIVGHCLGVYHPHGDQSVYDALVNMAGTKRRGSSPGDPWFTSKTHEPLIWGFGNFGDSSSKKQAGAMRYTECKLSQYADTYLLDPEYLAVMPMQPNFDGTTKEPMLLPAKIPNILVNGTFGIAVALTTHIPTFSVASVKKAAALALQGTLSEKILVRTLEPEFVGGGFIPEEQHRDLILNQSSSVEVYAEVTLEDGKLVVRDTPPGLKADRVLQILSADAATVRVKDETGPQGIELAAYGKKMSDTEARKWQQRVQHKMKSKQSYSINVTERKVTGAVLLRTPTILEVLVDWAKWRIVLEKRVVKARITATELKKRRTEVLLLGLLNFSVFEKALKADDSEAYLVKNIKGITSDEAKYLLDQPMRRFKKLAQGDLEKQIKELIATIAAHGRHLANPVPEILKGLK